MFNNLPDDATGYVLAAYLVFLLLVLIYIGILGVKFQRISRDIGRLTDEVEAGRVEETPPSDSTEPAREESNV